MTMENNIVEELRDRLKDLLFCSVQYLHFWIDGQSNPYEVEQRKEGFEKSYAKFQNVISACPKEYDLVDWPKGGLRTCARKTLRTIRRSINGLEQAPNMVWADTEIGGRERHCKDEIQTVRNAIKSGLVLFELLMDMPSTPETIGFGIDQSKTHPNSMSAGISATGVSPFSFG